MASDWMIVLSFFIGILVILILITIHEFGHFIVAKLAKAYVYEFSIGFGPKIFTIKGKETWFVVRAIPLGGFCSIASDKVDPPVDREDEQVPPERKMDYIARWKKAFFILSGPLFNLFVALFLFTSVYGIVQKKDNDMYWYGANYSGISEKELNAVKGTDDATRYIIMGWEIKTLDDKEVFSNINKDNANNKGFKLYDDLSTSKQAKDYYTTVYGFIDHLKDQNSDSIVKVGDSVKIQFAFSELRNPKDGNDLVLNDDGTTKIIYTNFNESDYKFGDNIGIAAPTRHFKSFGQAYGYGWKDTFSTSVSILKSFGLILTGHINQFSGPVGMSRQVAAMLTSPSSFFLYIGMLSANLFVINLITVPPLDGFKFVENLVEMAMRKEISEKVKIVLYSIGAILFAGLFLIITIKDFI